MSNFAIQVENLSKRYRIGERNQARDTLVGTVTDLLKRPLHNFRKLSRLSRFDESDDSTIWALEDVSFEIRHGETVGIIGHNGAGKSTLLKVLSRITYPTSGRATIYGRVSSLLEVGTGFHPELTGRENIYLNAAILGMTRSDVARRFDAIVAFAGHGVERFLDTPLKRYSSGMKVRLAFAVAAHLEPEILIVDEVLAVGDVEFQAKCLGKMGEVARGGRTVILVSHSMGAITNLCRSVMWFDQGRLLRQGTSRDIVRDYLQSNTGHSQGDASLWRHEGVGGARIQRIEVLNARGLPCDAFPMGETVLFEFDVDFMETFTAVDMSVVIRRPELGMNILCAYSKDAGFSIDRTEPGTRRFRIEIPECNLYPSSYSVSVFVGVGGVTVLDSVADVLRFSTVQSGITGRTTRLDNDEAVYYAQSRWSELEALETQDEGALANG